MPRRLISLRALRAGPRRFGPILALLVAVGASPANGFVGGVIAYERDTPVFYYPLFAWAAQQLHGGSFPLWLPEILGGYPLFADGEIGLAAPQVLVALMTLPTDVAFIALRVLHMAIAALGAYMLARAWRLRWTAATLVGITFTLGSFVQAHIQHENIVRSAAWLPLALACLEHALRVRDRRCLRWLAGAGVTIGFAGLGLHPQILVADLLTMGAYGVLRTWAGPSTRTGLTRLTRTLAMVVAASALGVSIAAVQLAPLAELGALSARAGSFPYTEVAGQSLTPFGFTQLVVPFVFRDAQLRQWGLWTHWESYLYIGLAPLMLVLIAVSRIRHGRVLLWFLLAAFSLVLALGQYSPIDTFGLMRSVPGLGWLRAPGRFSLIAELALAMLAGYGLLALEARARTRTRPRWRPRSALAMLSVPVIVAAAMLVGRAALLAEPDAAQQLIERHYLSLPHDSRWMLAADVYGGLLWSTNFENARTAGAVLGLLAISIVLVLWQYGPWWRARRWRGWPAVLVTLAAVDLLIFGWSIHPRAALSTIATQDPTALAVRELVAAANASDGPVRVFASPVLDQVSTDRLAPLGLQEVSGYSSLEPSRHRAYLRRMRQVDDDLLDLWNARYIFDPAEYGALPSYGGVQYAPGNFLLRAASRTDLGDETLRVPGAFPVAEIRIISALAGAGDVPQGQPVAVFIMRSESGQVVAQAMLRAGRQVMDWGWDDLAPWGAADHGRVEVAGELQEPTADGGSIRRLLSFGTLSFREPATAATLEIQNLTSHGELIVAAAALVSPSGEVHQLLGRASKTKYRKVLQDNSIMVLENTAAFPRAYLVQDYQVALPNASFEIMEQRAFQPREEVVLAADTPPVRQPEVIAPRGGRAAPAGPGTAIVKRYEPRQVVIDVSTAQPSFLVLSDAYYPGWRAYVDGIEQPILRGNLLFRVVQVPEGTHEVVFRFEPTSVMFGLGLSLCGVVVAFGLVLAGSRRSAPM